jgi:endonuclease YncB( thermonuclease family)
VADSAPPAEIGEIAPLDPPRRNPDGVANEAADSAAQRELKGRVVRVADGDTLTIADRSGRQYRIRLVGIDAPELVQPFGPQSRQALSAATRDQTVRVLWRERDQFDRVLGDAYVGGQHVNREQVARGWAWRYLHARDPELAAAEHAARTDGVGLWSQASPTPPWEYRREQQDRTRR